MFRDIPLDKHRSMPRGFILSGDNATEEGKAMNRRVSVNFKEK
jgi:hypothetical protein